ncbi:pyridoxal phosphate-dependent transferase [Xylaria bambusicola]|uniref:pyridoxal phosphate-dependent transferase n=1 Tax=Xylaria bambusicola TaxID=326684 RepID=UPI002008C334|nr:pyridoxal phosphate-dependent transferase [Xylaria bambusicola]KAI0526675.1 pyridoxal phosphate-dependent transferase [Xylaria bambusicola]
MDSFIGQAQRRIRESAAVAPGEHAPTLPGPDKLAHARASLPDAARTDYLSGRGPEATLDHLLDDIVPGLNGQNRSGRYWGFVTGSTLPIAEAADNIVSAYDQNVQVHLPNQTIATEVEDAALKMLLRLLRLGEPEQWEGRTFTTGATGSNVLGLACGREAVITARVSDSSKSVGELGLLRACAKAGIEEIQVLTSMGHSSLSKAASVVGLGRAAVKLLPFSDAEPWRLDIDAVERELRRENVASIIAISAGEVNTGRFATAGVEDMTRLRRLADQYRAWIHVDGAFGVFARILPEKEEYASLHAATAGLELCDSLTIDGHKFLNVPYDNGIFFTRKSSTLSDVFKNPNAAYLSSGTAAASAIQSPLNIGLENSRRFRAFPVYAVLMSEGREGMSAMMEKMVLTARAVARAIRSCGDEYVLLPDDGSTTSDENVHMVVLFRARDDGLNSVLVQAINEGNEWYVSGSSWGGKPAVRVAVSSWRADARDAHDVVRKSLGEIARGYRESRE